jgi:cyclophilin family peptidyl-prolyl cis-trans isomerase/Ca2+-binding RTX toxin-like protein
MASHLSRHHSRTASSHKTSSARKTRSRLIRFEPLESRHMLSISLSVIGSNPTTVTSDAPSLVAVHADDTSSLPVNFTVSSSNSSAVSATVLHGHSLRMMVQGFGEMDFLLFDDLAPNTVARIIDLVNSGFYNSTATSNMTFHRVIKDFMIQGGDPSGDGTGGSGTQIDDEFDPNLLFTGPGILAMANRNNRQNALMDTGDSQFFITAEATRWLDFNHTIFGYMTKGTDVLQAIEAVPVDSTTNKPTTPVVITSMEIFSDTQDAVIMLKSPLGTAAGSTANITVTADDGQTTNTTSLALTTQTDTNQIPAILQPVPDITTTADTPAQFTFQGMDPQGGSFVYAGIVYPDNANMQISVDSVTGATTVTPSGGIAGVFGVEVGLHSDNNTGWDSQVVPVFIHPKAPSRVDLLPLVAGQPIQFRISGVMAGTTVTLFADGQKIGEAQATGTTVDITTDSGFQLTGGSQEITAVQTLKNQQFTIGNRSGTIDLASDSSTPFNLSQVIQLPAASGGNQVTIRRNGDNVELVNDLTGELLVNQALTSTNSLNVLGVDDQSDSLTVDFSYGGMFALADGITFNGGNGAGTDAMTFIGSNSNGFDLRGNDLIDNGQAVHMDGVEQIRLEGGAGSNNYVLASSNCPVTVVNSSGTGTLNFFLATGGVNVNLALSAGQPQVIAPWSTTLSIEGNIANLWGTNFNDVLAGNAGNNIIHGLGGVDGIHGGGGTDVLYGDTGNDYLYADKGNCVLMGGDGNDILYGGPGKNLLIGGMGADVLYGGKGDNIFVGGSTVYDANDQALLSVLAEGVQGGTYYSRLARINSRFVRAASCSLQMGSTTTDDSSPDLMLRGGGRNWFLACGADRIA